MTGAGEERAEVRSKNAGVEKVRQQDKDKSETKWRWLTGK